MKLKDNGKKANYSALRGLVLDSDIFEVVSSTAGLLFTVKVKKTGTYSLNSTVFANFNENSLVRILAYLNSTLHLSIRNTANYKSITAGLDLSEQMVMPLITIDAIEGDNLSIQVTGTTSVGSEWGFFITKIR